MRALHVLLVSSTWNRMSGADRDWVNLSNALGPGEIRLSWAGVQGTSYVARHLREDLAVHFIDLGLPPFTYLLHEKAHTKRGLWLWSKILADYGLRLVGPTKRLAAAVAADPVDLVATNTALVFPGAVLASLRRLPHIWFVKECLDIKLPAHRHLARAILRLSSAVVAPSLAAARPFGAHDKVRVIPDGSDPRRIRQRLEPRPEVLRRLHLPEEGILVAQMGGGTPFKGQHVTAEAFARLATQYGRPRFSLAFLGGFDPAYRERVEAILSRSPFDWRSSVRFASYEPDDFSLVAASDIIVHPSTAPDPFPNAVREAMLLGKPVVAARTGGIPEMIEDGVAGFLIEPGDAAGLEQRLARLVAEPELREDLGRAARAYAESHFDIEERKKSFAALFRSVAESRA